MTFQEFKTKWLGKRVDYDHVYAFQCVDLIRQYLYELHGIGNGVSGNAIDYAKRPSPALLDMFDKLNTKDCQPGDIVVLNGLAGNPYGHIGICVSQNNDAVEVLEQNGSSGNGDGRGGNAIRTRFITKSRIAGVLRRKTPPAAPGRTPRFIHLKNHVVEWSYYRPGTPLPVKRVNRENVVRPKKWGGITYPFIRWVADKTAEVKSPSLGIIWIYVDGDAEIRY